MTKYYCKQCDPTHKTIYDESFVSHTRANSAPGNVCIFCKETYSELETASKEQVSANIKFKGAGWASKDIKLQRDAIRTLQNRKYKQVDE